MLLFVDETENEDLFIVTGFLVKSKEDADFAYKHFKRKIRDYRISDREKRKLFTEFKSTLMDQHYQKLKIKMLEEVIAFDNTVIYSTYIKKDEVFRQSRKEDIYVLLLSKIVASLEQETEIIYDTFNKHDFEERINATIAPFSHITSIHSADSRTEAGLQFVDNLCSVIRLYEAGKDHYSFYQIIADRVKMI